MKLLLASNNKHKLKELFNILKLNNLNDIEIITPDTLNSTLEVDETGTTFEENSKLKADAFYNQFNIPTIADDSGLEIETLDNKPGVYSARFSGMHGNDKANRIKVLSELGEDKNRNAQFRTVICFYDGVEFVYFNGICKGSIAKEENGINGFGYDSIFIPNSYDITFAQMEEIDKNKISHRANALIQFVNWLKEKTLL